MDTAAAAKTDPTLILDVREAALAAELRALGVPFTSLALDAGDFLIQGANGDLLLVAERKTHADFAASNADGRYREQRARLMAIRGSGVAVLYLLEGSWTSDESRFFGGRGTTEGQLKRLATRLMLRYGMPVLAAADLKETARWCRVLLAQLTDDPAVFVPESGIAATTAAAMTSYTASISVVKKENRGPHHVAIAMLSTVPGLGEKRVAALLAERNIVSLAAIATPAEIAALVVGGKRLGASIGAALFEALRA
jgi:ERCC4-type nuclease